MATGQAGIRRGWRGLGMGTAGVVALASAGLAGAQEAPDDVTLATIVVEGEGATTEGTDSYAATGPTSTATGLPLTLRETPQSVSVVTRQELDDRDIRTLQDVVQATPGSVPRRTTARAAGASTHAAARSPTCSSTASRCGTPGGGRN